jgi:hypothetical protein
MSRWERRLRRNFPTITWVRGQGRFAALFPCRHLTVYLFATNDEAEAFVERVGDQCGGQCMGEETHFVVDLQWSDENLQEICRKEVDWRYAV